MKISGIYQIQSKVKPERIYIGSAVNITDRWRRHKGDLKRGIHGSKKLQRYYDKYTKDDLIFIIIEPCLTEFLIIREQFYIDTLMPYFNSRPIADSQLGFKHSEETKRKMTGRKMSEEARRHMSKPKSKEHIKKMIDAKTGKKLPCWSEERRQKMSKIMKGRVISEEWRNKISASKKGQNGWKLSEDTKRKMRDACKKRKPISEETRKRLSESHLGQVSGNKGNKYSEESKRNLSESHKGKSTWMKGKHHTEESKEKNRLAHLGKSSWNKGLKINKKAS